MTIAKTVKKLQLDAPQSDAAYWRSRPPAERLAAVEEIRREYHRWKFGAEPRLQRVCSIVECA